MNAAAITDHGVMYGEIEFYRECKKNDINPILGCEVYVAPGSRFDREQTSGEDRYYHLILLAENNKGYENLVKIVSAGFIDGFYYKPRVDMEILEKYHEGLICLSACLAGEVARNIVRGNLDAAKETALRFQNIFGKDNYFLEMQDHGIPAQKAVNQGVLMLHNELGIPMVVTNDCHYTYPEDADPHDILLCIQTGKKVDDEDRMRYEGGQYYVKSEDEMRELFPFAEEALENTQKIADRCHVDIEFGNTKLPHFEVPEGYDSWTYLNKLCDDGLVERYGDDAPKYKERLDYELSVIKEMGYVDYFLIVWDFINYAKVNGIPVGPGRGSAAGSIVSYAIKITDIDPIKYSLIFERFLNPERVSMPDIDIDFDPERRGEVIDYVVQKYGQECVTQIVTFGTMKAKGVVRDVGRVLDYPYAFADAISKSIPAELDITIEKALMMNPELKQRYESEPEVKKLIDISTRLEGLPRNIGMHAAGVVIAQKPMYEFVPVARGAEGSLITQYEKTTIEELGLLKMDFLGLRNLTVIQDAVELVNKRDGVHLDINSIDYNDRAVYDLISSGKTEGIFQLESAGMKSFMKELKPNSLEDVIAGISLYRPGPMDFIPRYIKGKNNPDGITYDTPLLEPILSPTYGCIVYQEQVMQIVRDLAGYSMGRSDLVRRAMSKKKADVMEKERQNFVYGNKEEGVPGCIAKGIPEEVANRIYDEMIDFAKYAFNKSHAACYAYVAYMTAYLKTHYPVEFMAALMTSVLDNTTKVSQYISVCREMGIEVLPPDVNVGEGKFAVADGKIRYGMCAIKSLGNPVVNAIVEERAKNGKYETIQGFLERLSTKINKRAVESLIKAGALDCLEGNRRQKIMVYEPIIDAAAKDRKNTIEGQMTLFDFASDENKKVLEVSLPNIEDFDKGTRLAFEKEVLGIYVSGHPLEENIELMKKTVTATSADFYWDDENEENHTVVRDGSEVIIGGIITEKTVKFTRKNQAMAFITVEDLVGSVEVIVFPRDFEKNRALIEEDNRVFIRGRVNAEEDKNAKLICSRMAAFSDAPKEIWIRFSNMAEYEANQNTIDSIERNSNGKERVVIYIADEKVRKIMPYRYLISENNEIMSGLKSKFGEKNISVITKSIEL